MTEIIYLALIIGVSFFSVCVVLMCILYSWEHRNSIKSITSLIFIIGSAASLPLMVKTIYQQTSFNSAAEAASKITLVEVATLDKDHVLVNVNLSSPAPIYLKYQDASQSDYVDVQPTSSKNSDANYSFIIAPKSRKGGTATIVVNGQDYLWQGAPITIKAK
jgi:hypothetical protein